MLRVLGSEKSAQSFLALSFSKPGTSLPKSWDTPATPCLKQQKRATCIGKVFVRDIPTSGSLMSQGYPAPRLYL